MTEQFGNPSSQYPLGKAAAKRREEILAQADKDCEALKKEAGSHMGKATQAILGRVVGN